MPTSEQIQQAINKIGDQPSFIQELLVDALGWPIQEEIEDLNEIAFEWTAEELNAEDLDRNVMGGRVFQIQPLRDDQPWGIFILEFNNEDAFTTGRGLTGPLRKVLRGLVPKRRRGANLPAWEKEHLLFVCTHQYRHFRFAYFKSPIEKGHAEPLITFGWGPDIPARTAYENLAYLGWPDPDVMPERWVCSWSQAFDIEKVTKKFYEDYERVFTNLQNQLELAEAEDKKMFAQLLMNRLMFLRFVERKGWLRFGDTQQGPQNYLKELFEAGPAGNSSWYNSRLKVLFFEGMAVPNHEKEEIIGQVPYLNGGLFEKTPLDEQITDVPDSAFDPILGDDSLFYRYNFTVEESTPLDIDVAVDPEMLGKVFEKLTNARRQKGSYYTPRTVVSFMCRETLKGYLGSEYAPLIDENKTESISVPEAKELLSRLDIVKVVDPACGSGAYLLGMLQELFNMTKLLDTRAGTESPHDAYQRKLQIIQNNLYGVDIDEFAVNIARLRMWLSLAVEFEGDIPEPLPNLDFKIETGNSLTAPDPSDGIEPGLHRELMKRYVTLQKQYLNPPPTADKQQLLRIISELKQDIVGWLHAAGPVEGFDWQVEFLEVFIDGGFDIVIANPPYGIKVDNSVRNQYFNQRNENEKGQSKDSYGIFLARGLQLLRSNGTLSYIVSDTWRTIRTHRPLRKRLLETTTVFHVLDLPPWIFDATVNTCVVTFKKTTPEEDHKLTAGDLTGIVQGNWRILSDNLIAVSGHGPDIQTTTCSRYTYLQIIISSYTNLSFFIGSPRLYLLMSNNTLETLGDVAEVKHGLTTGDNYSYIYKEQMARGSYTVVEKGLILKPNEMNVLSEDEKKNGFPDHKFVNRYWVPYDKGGASNVEEGWLPNYYVPTEYYIDWRRSSVDAMKTLVGHRHDNPDYYFRKGITFSSRGVYSPTFRLNSEGPFDKESACIFSNFDRFELIGQLTSKFTKYMYRSYIQHTVSAEVDSMKRIPIKRQSKVSELVTAIISKQKKEPNYSYYENEQKEIDALIYKLYGLSEDDIREIELWYCRRYQRLAEAQGVMAEVKEKYAAHLARCQIILEKPPSYWRSNPVLELIAQGESHTLEFKETLEYNIHTNERTPGLAKSSLKTIAAFLNADGGTLLIGVSDAGEVKGITRDLQFVRGNNRDGFEQKLRSLINDHFDPSPLGDVEIRFEDLQEGTVCQINVEKSSEPVAYDNDFYIRDGNGTRKLKGRDLADWLRHRNNS